jgi:hypothetical protein
MWRPVLNYALWALFVLGIFRTALALYRRDLLEKRFTDEIYNDIMKRTDPALLTADEIDAVVDREQQTPGTPAA